MKLRILLAGFLAVSIFGVGTATAPVVQPHANGLIVEAKITADQANTLAKPEKTTDVAWDKLTGEGRKRGRIKENLSKMEPADANVILAACGVPADQTITKKGDLGTVATNSIDLTVQQVDMALLGAQQASNAQQQEQQQYAEAHADKLSRAVIKYLEGTKICDKSVDSIEQAAVYKICQRGVKSEILDCDLDEFVGVKIHNDCCYSKIAQLIVGGLDDNEIRKVAGKIQIPFEELKPIVEKGHNEVVKGNASHPGGLIPPVVHPNGMFLPHQEVLIPQRQDGLK